MQRLTDTVETALRLGNGVLVVSDVSDRDNPVDRAFNEQFACTKCGASVGEIEPRTFSFNTPHGACPACTGLGIKLEIDPDLVFPNPQLTLEQGAIHPWSRREHGAVYDGYYHQLVRAVAQHYGIPTNVPVTDVELPLPPAVSVKAPVSTSPAPARLPIVSSPVSWNSAPASTVTA